MIGMLVWLVIICILAALAYYVINSLLPEPARKIAVVVLVVIIVIAIIYLLMPYATAPHPLPRR